MDRPKKVLILYASAGHGHEKAAKAVYEACSADPAIHARCEDVLRWLVPAFGAFYSDLYMLLITRMPLVWGFFYYFADMALFSLPLRLLRRLVNAGYGRSLARLIQQEAPDLIVSTHFLSTEVVAHLRSKGRTRAKLVTVITDFLPHRFWLCEPTDLYVGAFPETLDELVRRGVDRGRVLVLGIPISSRFRRATDPRPVRRALGLDPDRFTLLVTSGGAGVGSGERIARLLMERGLPLQVLFVCGTNAKLKDGLASLAEKHPGLKLFGFVDNMHELMAASDLLLGKAGGLTVTESLAIGTPMVVLHPIPGQEGRNAASLVRAGAGIIADDVEQAVATVAELVSAPTRLAALKQKAQALGKPDAASDLAKWIRDERIGG